MSVTKTAPLSVLDELYLFLHRRAEPFSVHFELRVQGRIDADRLRTAVREAATRHPLARASLAGTRVTDVSLRWEIADELRSVDLREVECRRPADVARARERLLNRIPDLARPGPFSLLLAHDRDGDVLVMNLHHAAGDGISAARLMRSIALAYCGAQEPPAPVEELAARDLAVLARASPAQHLARGRTALGYLSRLADAPTRIAPVQGNDRGGYGFRLLALGLEGLERVRAAGPEGTTVNDVLLAGLAVAVARFNERHGGARRTTFLSMPMNLRPPAWREQVLGNFAAYMSVRVSAARQDALEDALRDVVAGTRHIKQQQLGGYMVDLFRLTSALPTALKRRMPALIPLSGNFVVDTAILSNLGPVAPLPALDEAGEVKEIWFSPPGRAPIGVSVGAATLEGRLFLTLRYLRAVIGARAAAELLETLREALAE